MLDLAQSTQPSPFIISPRILICVTAGALSAAMVDLHAYQQSDGSKPFNWKLMLSRVLAGAFAGFLTAVGTEVGPI